MRTKDWQQNWIYDATILIIQTNCDAYKNLK